MGLQQPNRPAIGLQQANRCCQPSGASQELQDCMYETIAQAICPHSVRNVVQGWQTFVCHIWLSVSQAQPMASYLLSILAC